MAADLTNMEMSSASGSSAPTVVIIGPPWPHSGTARLFENQIEFYKSKGYVTIFLCVPIHCSLVESYSEWSEIAQGMKEVGADQLFTAPINERRFKWNKVSTWFRHGCRGTALDWIVFTGASGDLSEEALRILRQANISAIHVNHVFTLGFALRFLRDIIGRIGNQKIPILLETHDIQSYLLAERGEPNPWTHRIDSIASLLRSELALLKRANVLIHCSVDDAEFFRAKVPSKPQVLVLPTIEESFVSLVKRSKTQEETIDILFVGQSTEPNRAAMEWFFSKVWPLVAHRTYRLAIVGKIEMLVRKHLPAIYQEYKKYFTGPVSELAPLYSDARCIIAPMVSGTGISIKTVEALALGKPLIGTSKAFRGMPIDRIRECGITPYDTPEEFASAIVAALSDDKWASAASLQAYQALFSKRAVFAAREEALKVVEPLRRMPSRKLSNLLD